MNGVVRSPAPAEGRRPSRRQYFRVGTRLPIGFRRLAADELEARCLEVEAGNQEVGAFDTPMGAHLARLEAKLDELLALVAAPESRRAPLERRPVEISGAGLRMEASDPPPVGSSIWIEFLLPGVPQRLRAVGTIRRQISPTTLGGSPEIAVVFRAIRDSDRQAIVYFALEAERCRLRGGAREARTEA